MNKIKHFVKSVLRLFIKEKELFYTKEIFAHRKYDIGDYTYGEPIIHFENNESNLIIGKYCSISSNVNIYLGGNHRYDWVSTYPFSDIPSDFSEAKSIQGHPSTNGNVTIGNDVWIGANATILSGITIGNGAVVGTNSLITKDIGPYEIWGGNPARLIKKRFDDTTIKQLNQLEWWNWSDDKVKASVHQLCSDQIENFITQAQRDS